MNSSNDDCNDEFDMCLKLAACIADSEKVEKAPYAERRHFIYFMTFLLFWHVLNYIMRPRYLPFRIFYFYFLSFLTLRASNKYKLEIIKSKGVTDISQLITANKQKQYKSKRSLMRSF